MERREEALAHLVDDRARFVEREQRAAEHDRDGVVEHRLAEDHREEVDLDSEGLEDGEDGDGVGGRDERAKGE